MKVKISAAAALFACLAFIATLSSCKKEIDGTDDTDTTTTTTPTTTTDDGFVTNTRDTTFSNAVVIKWDSGTAKVTNPFSAADVTVAVTGSDVVVTATTTTTEVNYVLSGKATNGSFKLYSALKFGLVLNGVSLINDNGPAINIQSGKKVTVTVLGGTNNRLVDGATYATSTEDQKAAFFSEGQLNFGGTGNLTVTGNYKHGICSDDYIAIASGNITIAKAVSDGIHANDYFKMDGGTANVTSSGDGIDCEEGYVAINSGNVTVNSVDDGITASYEGTDATITPYVQINGGTVNITTTGEKGNAIKSEGYTTVNSSTGSVTLKVSGSAAKGFKTGRTFTLTNGNINITTSGAAFYDATDSDIASAAGVNADANFIMQGGSLTIASSGTGGKGISVDSVTTINGGTLNITTTGGKFTYGTSDSEGKGITGDGAINIGGGNISIAAADDGIKSDVAVLITNGVINISKSTEGVEAPIITVSGGTTNVVSSDDCFNATKGNGGESNDGSLMTFAGGTVTMNSTGGDPMDSNGSIAMTGGTVVVQGPPSAPEVAIDYNGAFNISGGMLIASGPNAGNMIQATSSTSAQNTVVVKVTGNVAAGTLFTIQNAAGNNLVTYAPTRNAYYFVFSSTALATGTYKVLTGGTYTGATAVNGYYTGGVLSGGTQKGTFTVANKVTTVTM